MGALSIVGFLLMQWTVGDMREIKPRPVILRGHPIAIEEAPYMARLMVENRPECSCGATIVSDRFVLSAAHCADPYCDGKKFVSVGSDKLNDKGQMYEVEKIIIHPNYDFNKNDDDILVVKLKNPLIFNEKVQATKMAEANQTFEDGAYFETMGFGLTELGHASKDLLSVSVPYVDTALCNEIYGILDLENIITENMICAGKLGMDSCQGDSGGPLIYKGTLVGVVSFGYSCGVLGVYTRVPSYRHFIDTTIEQNS